MIADARLWRRIALIAVLAGAAALRLTMRAAHPDAFQPDEVVNGYDAFCLAHLGVDHHGNHWPILFESFGDWVSPLLTYLTIPFVAIGGLSAFTDRLPGAIANIAAAGVLYLLAVELTASRTIGILAAALLAIAPWDIALAQWAGPPTLLPLLMSASLLFALRTIRTRANLDALAFALASTLLVYDYPTQKLFAPLLVIVAVIVFRGWRERAIGALVFGVLSLPMYLITFSSPLYNARFAFVALDPHDPNFVTAVLQRYGEYLGPAFLIHLGDMRFAPVLVPFVLVGFLMLLVAGLAPRQFPQIARRGAILIVAIALLSPLPASLTIDHFHLNRMAHALPLFVLLMATAVVLLVGFLKSAPLRWIVALGLAAIVSVQSLPFARAYYPNHDVTTGFAETQLGLGDALRAVSERFPGAPIVVDTSALNQPYIYYLFAVHYDPARLPFAQMRASQAEAFHWAYVSAIDAMRFRPVSDDERARATPSGPIGDPGVPYHLYRNSATVYLFP